MFGILNFRWGLPPSNKTEWKFNNTPLQSRQLTNTQKSPQNLNRLYPTEIRKTQIRTERVQRWEEEDWERGSIPERAEGEVEQRGFWWMEGDRLVMVSLVSVWRNQQERREIWRWVELGRWRGIKKREGEPDEQNEWEKLHKPIKLSVGHIIWCI